MSKDSSRNNPLTTEGGSDEERFRLVRLERSWREYQILATAAERFLEEGVPLDAEMISAGMKAEAQLAVFDKEGVLGVDVALKEVKERFGLSAPRFREKIEAVSPEFSATLEVLGGRAYGSRDGIGDESRLIPVALHREKLEARLKALTAFGELYQREVAQGVAARAFASPEPGRIEKIEAELEQIRTEALVAYQGVQEEMNPYIAADRQVVSTHALEYQKLLSEMVRASTKEMHPSDVMKLARHLLVSLHADEFRQELATFQEAPDMKKGAAQHELLGLLESAFHKQWGQTFPVEE